MDVRNMKAREYIEDLIKAFKNINWYVVNQFFIIFSE